MNLNPFFCSILFPKRNMGINFIDNNSDRETLLQLMFFLDAGLNLEKNGQI